MKTNLLQTKHKSKLLTAAVVMITVATFASGTLAYFTADDTAHNVITSGGVKIQIIEKDKDGNDFPEEGISGVMPGMEVTKKVTIQNNDADAWVRVKFEISVTDSDGNPLGTNYIDLETGEDWKLREDGYYYYKEYLPAGESSTEVLKSVKFQEEMPDAYQNCTVNVNVLAEAVQYANNANALGWPEQN